jgi:hypothetical protein
MVNDLAPRERHGVPEGPLPYTVLLAGQKEEHLQHAKED